MKLGHLLITNELTVDGDHFRLNPPVFIYTYCNNSLYTDLNSGQQSRETEIQSCFYHAGFFEEEFPFRFTEHEGMPS